MTFYSVFSLLTLVMSGSGYVTVGGLLVNGGQYRIRSYYDGLYATAGTATFYSHAGASLGNITAEKWGNFREQHWDIIGLDQTGKEFWVFSQENTFNKMSAAIINSKPDRHISELVAIAPRKHLIRSTLNGLCLDNPGYGLVVPFAVCDEFSVRQQWEFDFLSKN